MGPKAKLIRKKTNMIKSRLNSTGKYRKTLRTQIPKDTPSQAQTSNVDPIAASHPVDFMNVENPGGVQFSNNRDDLSNIWHELLPKFMSISIHDTNQVTAHCMTCDLQCAEIIRCRQCYGPGGIPLHLCQSCYEDGHKYLLHSPEQWNNEVCFLIIFLNDLLIYF